ncbi:MAG: glucose-6-phosphate dehydrogenase [Vicinamibacterales bacterium]
MRNEEPTLALESENVMTHSGRVADPAVMVIFGAAGDLTKRKLLPALANLARHGQLSSHFAVVGVARQDQSEETFRAQLVEGLSQFATAPLDPVQRDWFESRLFYVKGEFGDPALYKALAAKLAEVDARCETKGNYLYYLATPPTFFAEIAGLLGAEGLVKEEAGRWRRVIVEKPFGHDLASARELNRALGAVLAERQIYRIDHYLGKETVQNLMVFRFGNGIFEPIWNRRYIDHVQITVAETVGVEGRGGYYEEAGALRDMVQNHLFQLLALVAMEPPISFEADAVRDERVKVLAAVRPITADSVRAVAVRGQYGDGIMDGKSIPGYRQEAKVAPHSSVETFVALKLHVDSWRWADVPFYLRTGKRLPKRVSEVAIQFKQPPLVLFRDTQVEHLQPNLLIIRIQPDEGISLRFEAKVPGAGLNVGTVKMDFKYADYFGSEPTTGYETLLYDCMIGDSTLFHRADMVEAGWSVVMPILETWTHVRPHNFPNYPAYTWGPDAADELLRRDGRSWRRP